MSYAPLGGSPGNNAGTYALGQLAQHGRFDLEEEGLGSQCFEDLESSHS